VFGVNNCNSAPEACCRRDALGIPRCTIHAECQTVGGSCATSADCCVDGVPNSGTPCVNNVCGPACVAQGGTCTTTADCCGGRCVKEPGSLHGTCVPP
jgi:hypothetical protein